MVYLDQSTCIIRRGVLEMQPCVTLFKVSVNMLRNSDDLLYTRSILGHHACLICVMILEICKF